MDVTLPTAPVTVALGSILLLGSIVVTWQKIVKNAKKTRDERDAKILQAAKEADFDLKIKLEARIEKIDAQLKNLEFNVNKDMTHLKDTYSAEIKVLGEKIELLRDDLRNQHAQIVNLLADMIKNKS